MISHGGSLASGDGLNWMGVVLLETGRDTRGWGRGFDMAIAWNR